jgi:hypothetical protein
VNACAIAPDGVTIVAGGRSDRINFLRLEGIMEIDRLKMTVDCW